MVHLTTSDGVSDVSVGLTIDVNDVRVMIVGSPTITTTWFNYYEAKDAIIVIVDVVILNGCGISQGRSLPPLPI